MNAQSTGRLVFNILTAIFAVIGGLTLFAGLAFGGLILWMDLGDKAPLKWPLPTRECQAAGGQPLTDAKLLEVAVARWNADAERAGEAYRRKYVGGPVLLSDSFVERLNVAPANGTVYVNGDLETNNDIKMRYRLAGRGVRQYAQVTLDLEPPVNPVLTVQATTAKRSYVMDLCGHPLH